MKQYIKAEWMLYKKNRRLLVAGLSLLVAYAMLLLFSPIGGPVYSALITMVGFIGVLYMYLPLFFTPGYILNKINRQKVITQQLLLCLGESNRVYYVLRFVAFYLLLAGILLITAIMQLPAYLISQGKYSLDYFGIEVMILTALFHFFMVMICLVPARHTLFVLPLWCGFCGGLWGGLIGDGIGDKQGTGYYFRYACILAAFATGLAVISMIFRYVVIVLEEKGRKPRKG